MIIGIGSDIVDIRRIEKLLARYGARFTQRIFTADECRFAENCEMPATAYANRFAAKEACAKALGVGFQGLGGKGGVRLVDMEVCRLPQKPPQFALHGTALEHLHSLLPAGHKAHIHVSMSDEPPYAQAFVLIDAQPK